MNYNDYLEIKKYENFEESQLVKIYLNEASKRQKWIKGLKNHDAPQQVIDKQIHEKDEYIWLAIFTGIDEKKQGWRYVEDGPSVEMMLKQKLESIKEFNFLREKARNG